MGKKDMNGKDFHNSLLKDPLEKETNPQHVCGDDKGKGNSDGDTSKEDEVSKMQETITVDVVHDTASPDHLAVVVFNEPVEAGSLISNATPALVLGTSESKAMVIYEEVVATEASTILPQAKPKDDDIIQMITREFDILKNELAAEGVFVIPEIIDEDFQLKWSKAATKYNEDPIIPDSGNTGATASEWKEEKKRAILRPWMLGDPLVPNRLQR